MSIILDHVTYIYGKDTPEERHALKDVSFVVPKGQFIGIIGHTGSGKSTLIQLMNGLLQPADGMVLFEGEDISDKDYDKKKLREKVGMVFQYPEHQLFESTVFQDVCFGPRNLGLSRKEMELRAFQALRLMNFPEELYYQSPFDLSGGQKRRAAIAGVLAMEPDFLILDEPTAGLDPRGRDEILGLIARLKEEQGKTILLVSHSMDEIAGYADRILVMSEGKLLMDGAPKEIFARYRKLEEIGLAAPQVTYIMNALQERGLPVRTSPITINEAKREILRVLRHSTL
ncbi:MAG: energy-coupling factor transporter ATPase [Lachnospiraceae bacterium]|nr:energy-coupling factor transporter ATPase [Lachnospiraceae bacterium]